MFTRWGAFVYRRRRWLAVLAIVVGGGFGSMAGSASSHLTSGGWLDPGSESAQVSNRLEKDFGAGRFYAGVAVRNTGADAKAFWYYYNVSASSVASYLSANKARLVSFQRRSADRYDVVMVAGQGEGWWWYYDQTQASVNSLLTANKSRLIDVSRYMVNGSPRFAVVMLQNW